MRSELGDAYVDDLFRLYDGRVPCEADLVSYWFEKARAQIAAGKARRVGLLATQAIRGGANRRVLERIRRPAIFSGRSRSKLDFGRRNGARLDGWVRWRAPKRHASLTDIQSPYQRRPDGALT